MSKTGQAAAVSPTSATLLINRVSAIVLRWLSRQHCRRHPAPMSSRRPVSPLYRTKSGEGRGSHVGEASHDAARALPVDDSDSSSSDGFEA